MLAHAERKVAEHGLNGRVRLYPSMVAELPKFEPFDVATLLLVLHFLEDDGSKLGLLRDIAEHLKPGAPLVLGDLFGPPWSDPWQGGCASSGNICSVRPPFPPRISTAASAMSTVTSIR